MTDAPAWKKAASGLLANVKILMCPAQSVTGRYPHRQDHSTVIFSPFPDHFSKRSSTSWPSVTLGSPCAVPVGQSLGSLALR